ncbi:MAG: methylated-DNA--[protein]-cysteine S-methyltransferase, partial [Solirubrobacterales bacterium]
MSSALAKRPRSNGLSTDMWIEVDTPGGRVFAAFSELGISYVAPAHDAAEFVEHFHSRTGRLAVPAFAEDHQEIVEAILSGERALELCDLQQVSPFTRRVLEATSRIERGQTRSYQWLARSIGMPEASRAVGNALGSNPIPLAIPCHRIVRGDGTLGGYAFGTQMKRSLLEHEGALPADQARRRGAD